MRVGLIGIAALVAGTVLCGGQSALCDGRLSDKHSVTIPLDQLPAAVRTAKSHFVPLTAARVSQVKEELQRAADRLDGRLGRDPTVGPQWRKYLEWEQMRNELGRPHGEIDLRALDSAHARFAAGHPGLELLWFSDVRRALHDYLLTARAMEDQELSAKYAQLMDSLADRLQAYAEAPGSEEALVIGRAMQWMAGADQAPEIRSAIAHHYRRPNLHARVSADLVGALIEVPVDDVRPVRDVILKTNVFGTGHTRGTTRGSLVSDARRAVIEVRLQATVESETIGYNGPARIYSDGVTQLDGRKRLHVDALGIRSFPAVSRAKTKTTITGLRLERGGKVVEKIARRKIKKQKPEAERIAALHAQWQLNRQMNEQVDEMIGVANSILVDRIRKPVVARGMFPERLDFATTEENLLVSMLQADAFQLAAPGAPPKLNDEADLTVRMHQSCVNNMAASALAGVTVEAERLREQVGELLGYVPEALKDNEGAAPWSITFSKTRPISIEFSEGRFELTIRGHRYGRGGDSYPAMNVTAVYALSVSDRGSIKAVRQGPLQVFPPGFAADGSQQLSTREQALRNLLQRRFEQIFVEEIVGGGMILPSRAAKQSQLTLTDLASTDGWLSLAWQRTEVGTTPGVEPVPETPGGLPPIQITIPKLEDLPDVPGNR